MATIAGEDILLTDIDADHTWNSRGGGWMQETDGGPDSLEDGSPVLTGLKGLAASIAKEGQDTPVDVIPHPDKEKGKRYFLVDGFRRFMAISLNDTEARKANGDHKPSTIKANIRSLSMVQARCLNLRENITRENITPADIAWGISEMFKVAKEQGRILTQAEVATQLSLTQTYVGRLLSIMVHTDPKVAANWRASALPLRIDEMYLVSKMEKSEQEAGYKNFIQARLDKRPALRGKLWTVTAGGSAKKIGSLLGTLQAKGYLTLNLQEGEPILFTSQSIREVVAIATGRSAVSPRQLREVADIANVAFKDAIARVEKEGD